MIVHHTIQLRFCNDPSSGGIYVCACDHFLKLRLNKVPYLLTGTFRLCAIATFGKSSH